MCYTTTLCIMEDNIKNVLMIMIIIIIKMAKSARNDTTTMRNKFKLDETFKNQL